MKADVWMLTHTGAAIYASPEQTAAVLLLLSELQERKDKVHSLLSYTIFGWDVVANAEGQTCSAVVNLRSTRSAWQSSCWRRYDKKARHDV